MRNLAAILALFDVDFPGAPQPDGIIEGPFQFYRTVATGVAADTEVDLLAANGPLAYDMKLRVNGFNNGAATHPTGVLIMQSISAKTTAIDNTEAHLLQFNAAWELRHTPAGGSRFRSAPQQAWNHFPMVNTVAVGPLVRVGGQVEYEDYTFEGGPWIVNCQSDALVLRTNSVVGAVTLETTVVQTGIIRGFFIPQNTAQGFGLLDANGAVTPEASDAISAAISARRARQRARPARRG